MADLAQLLELQRILVGLLRDRFSTKLCAVSSMSIVLYDYFVTFTQEVDYMWGSRWSIGKVLFFGIRYYTVAMIIFNTAGSAWINWHWVSAVISTLMSEAVLMLRIYVMFTKSKKILALLLVSFILTFATTCALIIRIMLMQEITVHPFPGISTRFCAIVNLPEWFYAFWIPSFVFETLLFVLALAKGYKSFRTHLAKGSLGGRTLLDCLVQDSVLYYFVIFAAYLVNMMVWIIGGATFIEIPIGFALALASVLSQRMFLNMRISAEASARRMTFSYREGGSQHHSIPNHDASYNAGTLYERDRKTMSIPLKTFSGGDVS